MGGGCCPCRGGVLEQGRERLGGGGLGGVVPRPVLPPCLPPVLVRLEPVVVSCRVLLLLPPLLLAVVVLVGGWGVGGSTRRGG